MSLPQSNAALEPIVEHFGGLPRQPKKQIAEYVASLGLPIPEIYPDLDAALESGEPYIARSEGSHELFYSGVKDSFRSAYRETDEDIEELKALNTLLTDPERTYDDLVAREVLGRLGFVNSEMWRTQAMEADFQGEGSTDFARTHSLSFWREETGANLFMLEDSGRPG